MYACIITVATHSYNYTTICIPIYPYTHTYFCGLVANQIQCAGVYDRRFVELYKDRCAGATTPKKIWTDIRKQNQANRFQVICECYQDYRS